MKGRKDMGWILSIIVAIVGILMVVAVGFACVAVYKISKGQLD